MGAALKSAPRSKRWEASVCRPWRREERRMLTGSNQAASMRMFLVSGVIMVSQPPMTPARPRAFFWSAMTRSSGSRVRSVPSRSFSFSPLRARRTMMPPSSLSRSKAWVGWPMPRRTKLLASTALEICFWLRRVKYSAIWPVLGAMVTLRRTWAVKRPQRAGASMVTGKVCVASGEMRGSLDCARDDESAAAAEGGKR